MRRTLQVISRVLARSGAVEATAEERAAVSAGCEVARAALEDAREYRRWWERILVVLGIAVLGMIVVFVVMLMNLDTNSEKVAAAASAASVIITTGLGAWVVARQRAAVDEVKEWAQLVHERCNGKAPQ